MIQFVSFEGGDGSGKSTQVRLLNQYLSEKGLACLSTREPGGTVLGKMIRRAVLEGESREVAPFTELFLYLADRAQHVDELIRPALKEGKIVLCDRFRDSTLAYQGYGRGADLTLVRQLNEVASGGISPDLTFLLNCPVELGLSRIRKSRGRGQKDRFERERVEFHEKVRLGFLEIARMEPERVVVLEATQSIEEIHEEIKKIVEQRLGG